MPDLIVLRHPDLPADQTITVTVDAYRDHYQATAWQPATSNPEPPDPETSEE